MQPQLAAARQGMVVLCQNLHALKEDHRTRSRADRTRAAARHHIQSVDSSSNSVTLGGECAIHQTYVAPPANQTSNQAHMFARDRRRQFRSDHRDELDRAKERIARIADAQRLVYKQAEHIAHIATSPISIRLAHPHPIPIYARYY